MVLDGVLRDKECLGDTRRGEATHDEFHEFFLQTPGSGEAFYRDASEPSTDETDAERPPDLDLLRASAERHPYIIEIHVPPPFEAAKEGAATAGS